MITRLVFLFACVHPKTDSAAVDSQVDSSVSAFDSSDRDTRSDSDDAVDSGPAVESGTDTGDTAPPPPPAPMSAVEVQGSYGVVALAADGAVEAWWGYLPRADWSTGWDDLFAASTDAICGNQSGVAMCSDQAVTGWTPITPPTPDDPTLVPDDWWYSWVRVAVFGFTSDGPADEGCALTDAGGLYCWVADVDVVVGSGVTDFTYANAGGFFWIQDGQVVYRDTSGALPADSFPSLTGEAVSVQSSDSHTCALMADGTIQCNDADLEALYGDDLPDQGTIPTGTFTQISIGYYVNCGVRTDGTLACWGNLDGAIYPYPNSSLADVPDGTYTQVSVSNYLGCAVRTDGCVVCWSVDFRYEPDLIGYNPTVADPLCYSGQALTLGE